MGVGLLQSDAAADDFLRHADDARVGDVVEEAGGQVGQVVDAEKLFASTGVEAAGAGQLVRAAEVGFDAVERVGDGL